jgi:acyl carrier protein
MTAPDALHLLEETLELRPNTLSGTERLADLEAWDSLSALTLIAAVDKKLGLPLPGARVARCRTVAELCDVLTDAAARRAA